MRIWTAISTNNDTDERCYNTLHAGPDYVNAVEMFGTKFPTHRLEAMAPGIVEMKVYNGPDAEPTPHPLSNMPAGF